MVRRPSALSTNVLTFLFKAEGSAPPSMTRMMLEEDAARPPTQSQLGIIKDVASLTYLAGADTTASAVRMFFLAMLVHPDVQAKAQAEVDRVVGPDRLPEVEDRERLPYVEAVVNECLRWIPVIPIGWNVSLGALL
jgi:cytochrome P450